MLSSVRMSLRARTFIPGSRALRTTPQAFNSSKVSPDTYAKDDTISPPSESQVYQVDSSSENVQGSYDPPTGQYSQKPDKEYATLNEEEANDGPGFYGQRDQRYGNVGQVDKEKDTSKPEEGPQAGSAGGRKPEGR